MRRAASKGGGRESERTGGGAAARTGDGIKGARGLVGRSFPLEDSRYLSNRV